MKRHGVAILIRKCLQLREAMSMRPGFEVYCPYELIVLTCVMDDSSMLPDDRTN
jgi:hypothetical protein